MFFNKQIDIKRKIFLKNMCQKQFYVSEVISHRRLVRNLPLWKQIAKKSKIIDRNFFWQILKRKNCFQRAWLVWKLFASQMLPSK